MLIRLNKYIAQSGKASRREADRLISEGRVIVNGQVILTLGHKIDAATDRVEVGQQVIQPSASPVYVVLNKPPGWIVTRKDPHNRPTVMQLLPAKLSSLFPVGRLDYNSEGILLLTNDGDMANRLLHPRYGIKKLYQVKVLGSPNAKSLEALRRGIYLDGKKTAPAKISLKSRGSRHSWLQVEIQEGRKREVRRLFKSIGHPVLILKRLRFAGLSLGSLKPGEWRYLTQEEIRGLRDKTELP